jgi:cyclic beta-1,2-glucan synthetase
VDSGNLAASLWTVKQAAHSFSAANPEHASELREIAVECDALVDGMDFSFLFNKRKKVLSVG